MTHTLEELTGKPYLSYSSLSTYLKCGESYRLSRIEKVPEAPAYWLPGGTAVHYGCEVFDQEYEGGLDYQEAVARGVQAYHDKFTEAVAELDAQRDGQEWRAGGRRSKQWPNGEDATWWRTEGPPQVARYADWRLGHSALHIWTVPETGDLAIELPFSTDLGNGNLTHGYIDRIFINEASLELIVVDLKSGQRTPSDPTQLALYATAVEIEHGIRPRYGAYYMTREGALKGEADLSRFDRNMLGMWLTMARTGIENELFLPHIDSMCNTCSVRNYCYAMNPQISSPF